MPVRMNRHFDVPVPGYANFAPPPTSTRDTGPTALRSSRAHSGLVVTDFVPNGDQTPTMTRICAAHPGESA